VDGEPARGTVAVVSKRVSNPGRHRDQAAWGDRDRLRFASDLEGQLALDHVERVGVPVVNVGTGHRLPRGAEGVRDRDVLPGDEDADRALIALEDHLPPGGRHGHAFRTRE